MAIEIYTSEGTRYGEGDAAAETDDRLSNFFKGGVRLAVDLSGYRPEVVGFFRARESSTGRAEQFYAVYTHDGGGDLWRSFKQAVTRKVEEEFGMVLTSAQGTEVFDHIEESAAELAGGRDGPDVSTMDQQALKHLFQRGENLDFRVPDHETALAIAKALLGRIEEGAIAISENGRINGLSRYNLVLEPNSTTYEDLEPVGDTERKMNDARDQMRSQLVDERVGTIHDAVQDLQDMGLSSSEIREKVHGQVPALEPSSSGGLGGGDLGMGGDAGGSGDAGGIDYGSDIGASSQESTLDRVLGSPVVPILGVVLALVVVVVAVNAFLFQLPVIGGALPGGGGGPLSVEAPSDGATIESNPVWVNGSTTADELRVRFVNASGKTVVNASFPVTQQSFSQSFELPAAGNYTLRVSGTQNNETFSASRNITFTGGAAQATPTPTKTPTPTPTSTPTPTPTPTPSDVEILSFDVNKTRVSVGENVTASVKLRNPTSSVKTGVEVELFAGQSDDPFVTRTVTIRAKKNRTVDLTWSSEVEAPNGIELSVTVNGRSAGNATVVVISSSSLDAPPLAVDERR